MRWTPIVFCVSGHEHGRLLLPWKFAQIYPEYLSCAVPIAGGGDLKLARRIANLPIWIFHSDKDMAVGIGGDKQMVKALKDLGSTVVKFTEYPDADHPGTRDRAYRHTGALRLDPEAKTGGKP